MSKQGPTVYSTRDYIQYPVTGHNRKKCEKMHVCVCIYIYKTNHSAVQQNHLET